MEDGFSTFEMRASRRGTMKSQRGTMKSTTSRKSSNLAMINSSRAPPRPNPGLVNYSDEDSAKGYDENPDDSDSLTEKPSEISSTDSQVRCQKYINRSCTKGFLHIFSGIFSVLGLHICSNNKHVQSSPIIQVWSRSLCLVNPDQWLSVQPWMFDWSLHSYTARYPLIALYWPLNFGIN